VDREDSSINAIVSVLMLREGWDVQNVTVVGPHPYTAKADILPEQTIGRGLLLTDRVRVYPTQPLEGSLGRGANPHAPALRPSLYLDRCNPQSVSPKVIPHNAVPSESSILATQPTGLPDLA
jgi:hypothetical protein